jgi:aryl-alcohol dehydrogenase-like predicted oxidoreductase
MRSPLSKPYWIFSLRDLSLVSMAWLLHNPIVTAPIIGPRRTLEQFESALRTTEITLDDDVINKLDAIFPGPGGVAPEAHAW